MRVSTDLLSLAFIFSQQKPLTPSDFLKEYEKRVLHSESQLRSKDQLEVFHRVGALIPMFRFAINVPQIIQQARQNKYPPLPLLANRLRNGTLFVDYLQGHTDVGYPVDPRTEAYQAWHEYIQKVDNIPFPSSVFLYSPYQLLLIPMLRTLVPKFRVNRVPGESSDLNLSFSLQLDERTRVEIEEKVTENAELAIILTALETKYLPSLRGHGNHARYTGSNVEEIIEYQEHFDPIAQLSWLGWDAERVRTRAERLLMDANRIDPLREWNELVRLCHPDKWNKLRGDALVAVDYRVAAEMLLRFYQDLAKVGEAPPLESAPKFFAGPYDERLQANPHDLDSILMDFGISPYPSLLLVLEGETEALLVPRIMDFLGIPRQRNFIDLFTGNGVNTDFGILATYIAVPRLGDELEDSIVLTRPPTHFLVAIDPEKNFKSARDREKYRQRWISQIHRAVPRPYRSLTLKQELQSLVHIESWDGQSFEFAHFSDAEIAAAILEVYEGSQQSSADKLEAIVGSIRMSAGNIENIWESWASPRPRKTILAEALWPVLERKIQQAVVDRTLNTIPVVRVLLKAEDLAARLPRNNVIMRHREVNHDAE